MIKARNFKFGENVHRHSLHMAPLKGGWPGSCHR